MALVVAAGVTPARAEKVRDDEDVRGPFDIRLLAQDLRDGDRLRFKIATHEDWKVADVKRGGFAIRVDSDRDRDFDRFILIEWKDTQNGGRLEARITRPDGEVIDRNRAHHRKPRRLTVWADRRKLLVGKGSFRVNAYSVIYGGDCGTEGCRDPVPDRGLMTVAYGGLCSSREPDITGTTGEDRIETSGRKVVVAALGGDDVIRVRRGSVIVCGGAGEDLLIGGRRRDVMYGGAGSDELRMHETEGRPNLGYGGDGNDLLYGGRNRDRLFGQRDDDYLEGRGGNDSLDGGPGRDDADGGRGDDTCVNADSFAC